MKRILPFFIALLGLHGAAQAQVVTTTVNVVASDDSQVSRVFSGTNWGNATVVQADGYTKPELVRALVRFNQTDIVNAIGTRNFMRARLVVTLSQAVAAWGTNPTLDVFRLTQAWSEGTVTWNSLFGAGEPFDTAHPTARAIVQNGATGTITFDVTNDVAAFLGGAANDGWVVKDDGWNNGLTANLFTSEASSGKPTLIIDSTPDPLATSATITFGTAGYATVNASVNDLLSVPVHGKTFATIADAVNWMVSTFNAKPVKDAAGNLVDATVDLTENDSLYYVDANNNVVEVDDAITSLLGGQDGIVTLAGTAYCIREDGCVASMAAKQPPAIDRECNAANNYCIKATSFKRDFFFYKGIGTKLEQKDGGYHKWHSFCWKHGFIPWSCKHTRGSNKLTLNQSFQVNLGTGVVGRATRSTTGTNTAKISKRLFALFAALKVNSDGELAGGSLGAGSGFGNVEGVCASGNGYDPTVSGASANTSTSKGSVDYICPDSVIY